jgi:hypothetical protein
MMSCVGVLWDADDPSAAIGFKDYKAAAQPMKIGFQSLEIRGTNPDWEGTSQAAAKGHVTRSSQLGIPCSHITENRLRSLP